MWYILYTDVVMFNVELSKEEIQTIIVFSNEYVKNKGLEWAQDALFIAKKMQIAMQEQESSKKTDKKEKSK